MSALASFRISVLALLCDPTNAIFSNDDVDQALRWSLAEYSLRLPLIRSYYFTVEETTTVHVLPTDFVTRHITNVTLYDEHPEDMIFLEHVAYMLDEQWVVETIDQISAGEVLQISYSAIHTIDDLDAAAGTTLPLADEPLIHIGAAGYAMQMKPRTALP
jgi:hypothetical protein